MSDSISALGKLAAEAAPVTALGDHLLERELYALRTGDENALPAAQLRHLASCAACRARLVEAPLEIEALVAPRLAPRTQRWLWPAVLAASVLLAFAGLRSSTRTVTLVQRSYVGVMGAQNTENGPVAAGDLNLELTLSGAKGDSAWLLLGDDTGKFVSSGIEMRQSDEGPRVELAPRLFASTRGALHAWAVYGKAAAVHDAASRLAALVESGGASDIAALRAQIEAAADASSAHTTTAIVQLAHGKSP